MTQTTAGLTYLNQSGALNESYSDVMGAMVDTANWTIGEGSLRGTLRDMADPPRFTSCNSDPALPGDCPAHPDHMDDYRNITWDSGGVHINSGIPNRAAVLIAAGGTHHGTTVSALGRTKTARLYYDTLTTRLTQNSRLMDAATATVQQAKDFAAKGLYSFRDEDVCEVAKAFAAVGLTTAGFGDLSPAEFVQIRVVYQRVSDGLETGAEIIPSTGFSRASIARDRRIVVAVTAADNESGIESITIGGGITWDCIAPGDSGTHKALELGGTSDEVRNGSAAPGHPLIRTAHFTLDPFESNPNRLVCARTDNSSAVVAGFVITVKNGNACVSRSAEITFSYLPRPAD